METLNTTIDSILAGRLVSKEDANESFTAQLQKVLNYVCDTSGESDQMLFLSLIVLYLFKMVAEDRTDVELVPIGVSNGERRDLLHSVEPHAMEMAKSKFEEYKEKVRVA